MPHELLQPGSVILFGEIHGAQELPALFGEAVCNTVASGHTVEVGFEVPQEEQASFDSFFASSGAPSDVDALLGTPFWQSDYQDGRRSRAIAGLLERLRQLRASGFPVSVFTFDIAAGEETSEREKRMADYVAAHVRTHPAAITMTLVGEVHAWNGIQASVQWVGILRKPVFMSDRSGARRPLVRSGYAPVGHRAIVG
ncbi:hypothetical protein ACFL3B_05950 [Gemmatimonadota bacterium]